MPPIIELENTQGNSVWVGAPMIFCVSENLAGHSLTVTTVTFESVTVNDTPEARAALGIPIGYLAGLDRGALVWFKKIRVLHVGQNPDNKFMVAYSAAAGVGKRMTDGDQAMNLFLKDALELANSNKWHQVTGFPFMTQYSPPLFARISHWIKRGTIATMKEGIRLHTDEALLSINLPGGEPSYNTNLDIPDNAENRQALGI